IGRALQMFAEGCGHRRIAEVLAWPETTVRGWCRRWRRVAIAMGRELLAKAVRWGWAGWGGASSPPLPCFAAMEALSGQWSGTDGRVWPWRLANLITGGRLLSTNTPSLLAAGERVLLDVGEVQPGGAEGPLTPPKSSPCGAIT